MIYKEFKTWRKGAEYRLRMVFFGAVGFVYFTLICGTASLFAYCIRQINAFCRRETVAACIITLLFLLIGAGWMLTFIHERSVAVLAQHRADSLAYELSRFKQAYDDGERIVIAQDTITIHRGH